MDVFTQLPDDLSMRVLHELPIESLARLALSSKALSKQVARRSTESALWKSSWVSLVKQAKHLTLIVQQGDEHKDEDKLAALQTLMNGLKQNGCGSERLFHLLKEAEGMSAVRSWMGLPRLFGSGQSIWRSCRYNYEFYLQNVVDGVADLCRSQTCLLVPACCMALEPEEIVTFATELTKVTRKLVWKADKRRTSRDASRRHWCDIMGKAITGSVRSGEWTVELATRLFEAAPYYEKDDSKGLVSILRGVPLTQTSAKQFLRSCVVPQQAAAVVLSLINRSNVLSDDEWEDQYEDDCDQELQLTDRADAFFEMVVELSLPAAVVVELLWMLIAEDNERHEDLEQMNRECGGYEDLYTYDKFVGTRAFLASWVPTIDFAALSEGGTAALTGLLASFEEKGGGDKLLKSHLVPIAMKWIMALVQPLKGSGRRSNAMNTTLVQNVERVCRSMLGIVDV